MLSNQSSTCSLTDHFMCLIQLFVSPTVPQVSDIPAVMRGRCFALPGELSRLSGQPLRDHSLPSSGPPLHPLPHPPGPDPFP